MKLFIVIVISIFLLSCCDKNSPTGSQNNSPYIIGAIDDVTLAEDFGSYFVIDLSTVFTDDDNDSLDYGFEIESEVIEIEIVNSNLMFNSIDNVWGESSINIWADDGHNKRDIALIETNVTILSVHDSPTFDPDLEGEVFEINWEGEIVDFSPWIEVYGQENYIQMLAVLVGEFQFYSMDYVDDEIYIFNVLPIGMQFGFPDQECDLWLEGGSHSTITFNTELPDSLKLDYLNFKL
jgi:hypothetical protein